MIFCDTSNEFAGSIITQLDQNKTMQN